MDSEIAQRAGMTECNLSPIPELAPHQHAPLPAKGVELPCSTAIFVAIPYEEVTAKRRHSPGLPSSPPSRVAPQPSEVTHQRGLTAVKGTVNDSRAAR